MLRKQRLVNGSGLRLLLDDKFSKDLTSDKVSDRQGLRGRLKPHTHLDLFQSICHETFEVLCYLEIRSYQYQYLRDSSFYCGRYPCLPLPEKNVIELDIAIIRSVLACSLHEVGELLLRSDVHDGELGGELTWLPDQTVTVDQVKGRVSPVLLVSLPPPPSPSGESRGKYSRKSISCFLHFYIFCH